MASPDQVKGGVMIIIGFFLTALIGAALLPEAFDLWFATNVTQGWGTIVSTLWPLVPPFIIVGVILYYVAQAFEVFD